jgi:hypothetical protein
MRLRHIDAQIFGVLVNTLYVGDISPAITYMLCAMCDPPMWAAGIPISHEHVPIPTKLTREVRGYPEIREAKVKCQPLSNCQSPSCGLAVSTSGLEITK